jgi:hypothetical protein
MEFYNVFYFFLSLLLKLALKIDFKYLFWDENMNKMLTQSFRQPFESQLKECHC